MLQDLFYWDFIPLKEKNCKMVTLILQTKDLQGNAKKGLDDFFHVQGVSLFFKKIVLSGLFFINRQLLIMDGHGRHVTFEAISQAKEINLDMITLPSHTSHVLQPLDVSCFNPFKITFRKV
jgi:hypothetical protein